jgi:predicted Zn-dependent peptidase
VKHAFTLDNGLKVTLVPFGHVPKVDVQLVVRAGNVNEGANEVWLADLTGDLRREGTTTRSSNDINVAAADMGGSVAVAVSPDETTVSGTALAEHASELVALVADMAQHPSFPEAELARLKSNRLRSLAVAKSQPGSLALEKFQAVLYPDHPYGRLFPNESMLQGYTLAQVRAFYDQHFNAARVHLFVAGRFDAQALERAIRDAFGQWKGGTVDVPAPPKPVARRAIHIVDRPGAVQSTMYVGLPTLDPSSPEWSAMVVTNTLLGGAFASRITRNIREDKGYTYSPGSAVSTRYRSGYWAEVADVTTASTGASLKEIFYEIDRLQSEPPPARELKSIQDYISGSFLLNTSTRSGLISYMRTMNLHGLPESYLAEYVKRVNAVTPEDVQRIARQYIQDENMSIVIVGDRKVIEEQVKPYGTIVP